MFFVQLVLFFSLLLFLGLHTGHFGLSSLFVFGRFAASLYFARVLFLLQSKFLLCCLETGLLRFARVNLVVLALTGAFLFAEFGFLFRQDVGLATDLFVAEFPTDHDLLFKVVGVGVESKLAQLVSLFAVGTPLREQGFS